MGRPGRCRCTTPMPARSSKAGWETGRVRVQDTDRRQRRRRHRRPQHRAGQPARRRTTGTADQADQEAHRQDPADRHRRPQLRRRRRRGRAARARVRYRVLPGKSRHSAARRQLENQRAFRRHVRWRTGSEGRVNCVKRDFGLNRARIDGLDGARTWCGHGIFARNLVKSAG
jgi:transposase, IS5 family